MLIDVTRLVLRRARSRLPTGVDRVGLAYIARHRDSARATFVYGRHAGLLSRSVSREVFDWLLSPSQAQGWRAWLRITAWLLSARPGDALAGEVLLNTGHTGLQHAQYAWGLRRRGAQPVFLIHDLIPITHPEYNRQGEGALHRRRLHTALTIGSGIIVNSQFTLNQLQAHADQHGLALPPAVVAPLAPGWQPAGRKARPLAVPYFVVLGTIEPRKNHLLLLQLWRDLAQRAPGGAPHLVVIGQRGWECEQAWNLLDRSPALAGHVHELNHCNDDELAAWLQHAQALLFPSFCEGYGMPAIEAVAAGVPVIASNLQVLRESVADVPDYADPWDGQRWLELVCDYARPDSPRRAAQFERLRRFKPASWSEHHRLVDDWLARLTLGRGAALESPLEQHAVA